MITKTSTRQLLASLAFVVALVFQSGCSDSDQSFVALPKIENNTITPRVIYIENPRFPKVEKQDLWEVLRAAAKLVQDHFGVTVKMPSDIRILNIDDIFLDVIKNKPANFDEKIGDFRNEKVNWKEIKAWLVEQIKKQRDPLAEQIEFARPYLLQPLAEESLDDFSDAIIETFKSRLAHWTVAKLGDGHPVIGQVPGRPDLPHNEYLYWALMAKLGIDAEIILTNQLVASVEYDSTPVHTSIRGGVTLGSAGYNPSSRLGSASVWVSLFPNLSNDNRIIELRQGDTYSRQEALSYAGATLAHEMGHLLFLLGHPWSNPACIMRPTEALDFASWVSSFDAKACRIGSSSAMMPGTVKIRIW